MVCEVWKSVEDSENHLTKCGGRFEFWPRRNCSWVASLRSDYGCTQFGVAMTALVASAMLRSAKGSLNCSVLLNELSGCPSHIWPVSLTRRRRCVVPSADSAEKYCKLNPPCPVVVDVHKGQGLTWSRASGSSKTSRLWMIWFSPVRLVLGQFHSQWYCSTHQLARKCQSKSLRLKNSLETPQIDATALSPYLALPYGAGDGHGIYRMEKRPR